jgi:hypothetical protein
MKNPVFHDRRKQIEIRYHFIRQCVDNKDIDVQFVRTADQLSDIMTKALGDVGITLRVTDIALSCIN